MKFFILFILLLYVSSSFSETLQVYSSRKEHLIKPLFDVYTEKTGVKIIYRVDKEAPLLQRLAAEKKNPEADLFLTVDAGNLWKAKQRGLLEPIFSPILTQNIPDFLRDVDNTWFSFSVRARSIVYHKERVDPKELSTYEGLGNPKWKGRLLLRTSKKVYNQSLVAMLLHHHGKSKTKEILEKWVDNFVSSPLSGDTQVLKAIANGNADVGIVNSYYLARLLKKDPQFPIKMFWANQKTSGTHINISGGGVVKNAKNKKQAIAFLEWLSQDKAQKILAYSNAEYPVNQAVALDSVLMQFGYFEPDKTNLAEAGKNQVPAIFLMDQVGYR